MPPQVERAVLERQAQVNAEWSGFLSKLDPVQVALLQKYTLLDAEGQPTLVKYTGARTPDTGAIDVKIGLDSLQKLMEADTTPDHRWTDWILFQAGGGKAGKESSAKAVETIKNRFIDERVKGFPHPITGQHMPKISPAEALRKWERNLPEVVAILAVGDEEAVTKLNCFGFCRKWPSFAGRYEKVYNAISKFLPLLNKGAQMNREIAREGGTPVPLKPDEFDSPSAMETVAAQISRYFASKKARDDIRTAEWQNKKTIYDDDVITAIAPLTYAAAVRYGWDEWSFANRERFEKALSTGTEYEDFWHRATQGGDVYVYLEFKVPVPSWISRTRDKFVRRSLTNLALSIPRGGSLSPEQIKVYDQENNEERTLADIRQMILNEPTRPPDTDDYPIRRATNVYKTQEEAEEIVRHLDAAIAEVLRWVAAFDRSKIKTRAMSDA